MNDNAYHAVNTWKNYNQKRDTITSGPMRHAFILVGVNNLFLCHQIMSHMEGHNFELVLEVELDDGVLEAILRDRVANGNTHYLANTDPFTLEALTRLVSHCPIENGTPFTFTADVWNSFPRHPKLKPPWEDAQLPIFMESVRVHVIRVVVNNHFNENTLSRKREEYHLFGKDDEAHIYHSVLRRPDYDHIASLKGAPDWLSQDQLYSGIKVSIEQLNWAYDDTFCRCPMEEGHQYKVFYFGIEEYRDVFGENPVNPSPISIIIANNWWYSTRIVNYFNQNPCPPPPDNELS